MTSKRTISESFRHKRGIGLIPFIPAGYPDVATTTATLKALDGVGAVAIEVGFPFSDPVADGPTIQAAYTAALAKHVKLADIFAAIKSAATEMTTPMVGMVSYSIVFRYGVERFLAEAKRAGLAGLLIPDLPPPEAEPVCAKVRAAGLDTVLLVAPTTPVERRQQIARLSSGFVYYLSVSGITGARDQLPADLAQNVKQLKGLTDRPVCVGFGISTREHLASLSGVADGAIVGSAIVKRMQGDGPEPIAAAVKAFCTDLLS